MPAAVVNYKVGIRPHSPSNDAKINLPGTCSKPSANDAWRIVLDYARRWQVEMSIRYTKSELAFESPRLLGWQQREKLMLVAALCYAFLLSLLCLGFKEFQIWLLKPSATEPVRKSSFIVLFCSQSLVAEISSTFFLFFIFGVCHVFLLKQ